VPLTPASGFAHPTADLRMTPVSTKDSVGLVSVAVAVNRAEHARMFKIILFALTAVFRSRRQLALESLALHHQPSVPQRTARRPRHEAPRQSGRHGPGPEIVTLFPSVAWEKIRGFRNRVAP
jgi:hypothetical protein